MIFFSRPEFASGNNLCYRPWNLCLGLFRNQLLFFSVIKYSTSVLGSTITALSVQGCWIVLFEEQIHQLLIGDLLFVVCHLHCLCVSSSARANLNQWNIEINKSTRSLNTPTQGYLFIGWIRRCSSDIAHSCMLHTRSSLVHKLHTPKTTSSKGSELITLLKWWWPRSHFPTLRTHQFRPNWDCDYCYYIVSIYIEVWLLIYFCSRIW